MRPSFGGPAQPARRQVGVVWLLALLFASLVAACASGPRPAGTARSTPTDEPDGVATTSRPLAELLAVPDAEPRLEAIRAGGANKPYQVLGRDYVPITGDAAFAERGLASWYGRKFHGRPTADGETYDMYAMTAAHPTLPIPSYARVRNPANGREVLVRINDRGPFHAGRIVDLSYVAALKLDLLRGVAPVELERITFEEIRAGSWRRNDGDALVAVAPAAPRALPPPAPIAIATLPRPAPVPAGAASRESMPSAESLAAFDDTGPPPREAPPASTRGWWVQLGAFRERSSAESFQRHVGADLDWLAPRIATFGEQSLYRVQAGPYASRDEASGAAGRIRAGLGLVPVIVERR